MRWSWGLALCACSMAPALPYHQDFAAPLGREWQGSKAWRVVDGALTSLGTKNEPLWLELPLPDDVRIEMTATSRSPAVDLKFEVFGDGEHHQSGYVVILAGWKNTKSIIARLWEHAPEVTPESDAALRSEAARDPEAARLRYADRRAIVSRMGAMQPSHPYKLRFERQGAELRFYVDGVLHLSFYDPSPLRGPGHDRFAFNDWASDVSFDDLRIDKL